MIFQDRDYQIEADQALWDYYCREKDKSKNALIAMPTGTGKAVVIARILKRFHGLFPRLKTLIPTHVKELVHQNHDKFTKYWKGAPAGINSEGLKQRDYRHPIIFCGIQSVYQSAHLFGWVDLVIIDEAHLVSPNDTTRYQKFIQDLKRINKNLKVIGLTATPWRAGQGKLTDEGGLFDICIFDLTRMDAFNRFISEGYLSPLVPRPMRTELNVDGVGMVGGDFNQSELQSAVDKEAITRAALIETVEIASDRNVWMVFATGIEHCNHICAILDELGVSNVPIHSKLKPKDREANFKAWREGRVKCAVSMGVLTTGVDYPEIDLIVMLRPTQSVVLWVQMLGRGTRPVYCPGFDLTTIDGRLSAIAAGPKQNCLVLDFARNTKRLGPINDPVLPRKKGSKGGESPIKVCPVCENYCHPTVRYCGGKPHKTPEGCGHEFTFEVKITTVASTDEIIRGELAIAEEFQVGRILYAKFERPGAPAMMRVSYYTVSEKGKRSQKFMEYVPFNHVGSGRNRAIRWWMERTSGGEVPETLKEALKRHLELRPSTHIRVHTNGKYKSILAHCFDGSYFGKLIANDLKPSIEHDPGIDISVVRPDYDLRTAQSEQIEGDDIPF